MELLLALALAGWAITICLSVWLLNRHDQADRAERDVLHAEIATSRDVLNAQARAHADQLERLVSSHRDEVAVLCQRIQAPEQAVHEHMGRNAPPDPPQVNLDDDLSLISDAERKMLDLAEELAAER